MKMSLCCSRCVVRVVGVGTCLVDLMPLRSLHVSLLCFLGLWEMSIDIFDVGQGPCAVILFANGC